MEKTNIPTNNNYNISYNNYSNKSQKTKTNEEPTLFSNISSLLDDFIDFFKQDNKTEDKTLNKKVIYKGQCCSCIIKLIVMIIVIVYMKLCK